MNKTPKRYRLKNSSGQAYLSKSHKVTYVSGKSSNLKFAKNLSKQVANVKEEKQKLSASRLLTKAIAMLNSLSQSNAKQELDLQYAKAYKRVSKPTFQILPKRKIVSATEAKVYEKIEEGIFVELGTKFEEADYAGTASATLHLINMFMANKLGDMKLSGFQMQLLDKFKLMSDLDRQYEINRLSDLAYSL